MADIDMDAANDALSIAKIALIAEEDLVFFSTVCMRLKHVFNDRIPTARTDGLLIEYSPKFFMEQTPRARTGLIFHEVGHVIFRHPERLREHFLDMFGIDINIEEIKGEMLEKAKKVASRYNSAADYVINLFADKAGLELPPRGLLDYQYNEMSTEDVFRLLPDDPEGPGGTGLDIVLPGQGQDQGGDASDAATINAEIDDILVQATVASEAADKPGVVPGEIARYVDELLNPRVPWHRLMNNFARSLAKDDYTMRKANRRYFPDWHLPSRYSEKVGNCAFMVDASGSVTDDEFSHMLCNTANFIKEVRPDLINFIQFDIRIKTNDEVKTLQDLREVDFHGRGGTNITEVLEWIIENKPVVSVIFTDGGFRWPEHLKPTSPIIWLIHDNPTWTAPVGKVIYIDYND